MSIKKIEHIEFDAINLLCDEVSRGNVLIFDLSVVKDEGSRKRILAFLNGYGAATGTGLTRISSSNMMLTPSEADPYPAEDKAGDRVVKVHVVSAADEAEAPGRAADLVGKGYAVVYNCENTSPEKTRDDVDYLSGFCYGVRGSIKILADKLFLVVPDGVETDF